MHYEPDQAGLCNELYGQKSVGCGRSHEDCQRWTTNYKTNNELLEEAGEQIKKMMRVREKQQGWSHSVAQRIANLGNRDEDGSAREGKGTAAEEIYEELWFGEY